MKLFNKKKKGFTIVELVIVIAVVGVLAAILIPTFVGLVNKTNVAADSTLVRELNNALAMDLAEKGETKHENMTYALEATDRYGFNVARIDAKASKNKILWDSKNGVFCYLKDGVVEYVPASVKAGSEVQANEQYKLWEIASDVDENSKYSTYLYNATKTEFETSRGFDVGNEHVTSVTYSHYEEDSNHNPVSHNVIIRTTGGTLNVNAPADTVTHYGEGEVLNVEAVDTANCYREYGKFVNAQIKEGKIVFETADASIENLLLIAKEDKSGFEEIVVEVKSASQLPNFDRTDVIIATNGTLVLEVVTLSTDEFIYLTKAGVIEQVYVTTVEVNTSEKKVTDNTTAKLASQTSQSTFTVAEQIANLGKKNENGQYLAADGVNYVNVADLTSASQIAKEAKADEEAIATGTTYFAGGAGTVKSPYLITTAQELSNIRECLDGTFALAKDIDMSQVETWTPIGTSTNPFTGKFDGCGFAVKNWNSTRSLFGYVIGTPNAKLNDDFSDVLNNDYTLVEANVSEDNYTAVIKNINFEDCDIVIEYGFNEGTLAVVALDCYIENYKMSNCRIRIKSGWRAGIMIGETQKSHIKNLYLASNNNIVCDETPSNRLGNFGLMIGAIWGSETSLQYRTIIDSCVNDASATINTGDVYPYGFFGAVLGCVNSYINNEIIIGCVNNGNLVINNQRVRVSVSGICGAHMGGSYVNIINCSNNGNITLTGNPSVSGTSGYDQISGICSYGAGPYINCSNRGTLTGNVKYIGGICAKVSSNGADGRFKNCSNTGYLYSENEDAKIGEISADFHNVTYVNVDAEDINTLNTKPFKVRLQNAGSATGTMIVPASVGVMEVDGSFGFTAVDLSNTNGTLELRVSNATITLLGNNPNASLTIVGTGNTVTVGSTTGLNNIKLKGANNTLTNNGTIGHLSLENTTLESVNNGTMGSVAFVGEDDTSMTFVNNGTIGQANSDWHTVQTQSKVNLTFTNNGTIYGNGTKYALLFYGLSDVTFNAGANSKLVVENPVYTAVFYNVESMRANSVTFNVAAGAEGVANGAYYGIATYLHGNATQVTVNFN